MTGIPLEISTKLVRSESSCHYEYIVYTTGIKATRGSSGNVARLKTEKETRERRFSIGKLCFSIAYKNITTRKSFVVGIAIMHKLAIGNRTEKRRGGAQSRKERGIAYLPFRRVSVGESAFINAVTTPRKHLIAGGWVCTLQKGVVSL